MKTIVLTLTLLALDISAKAQPISPPAKPLITSETGSTKTGVVEDGVFSSSRFGISLEIPKSLTIISTADFKVLNDAGLKLIKSESGKKKGIEEAESRTQSLIAIAAMPPGTPLNSALEIAATYQQPGVTSQMVLAKNIELFKGSSFTLKRNLGDVKIGRYVYSAADFDVVLAGVKFYQRIYILMHKGNSLVFVNTNHDEEQRNEIEALLAKVILTK